MQHNTNNKQQWLSNGHNDRVGHTGMCRPTHNTTHNTNNKQ
jgi:hypothetical protein